MTKEERQEKVRWLSRYKILENQIERLEIEQEKWRNKAVKTVQTPVHFKYVTKHEKLKKMSKTERRRNSMMPVVVRGSGCSDIGDAISESCDIEREIQNKINRSKEIRFEIGKKIDSIEDERLQLILYYKYVDGLYFEEIAVKMKYSFQHIKRLHNFTLNLIKI